MSKIGAIGDYIHLTWKGYKGEIESTNDKTPIFKTWGEVKESIQKEIEDKQKSNMLKVQAEQLEKKYNTFLAIAAGEEKVKDEQEAKDIERVMQEIQLELQEKIPLAILKKDLTVDFDDTPTHHKIDLNSSKKFDAIKIKQNIQDLEILVNRAVGNLQKDSKRLADINKAYKEFTDLQKEFITIVNTLIQEVKNNSVDLPSDLKAFYIPLSKKAKFNKKYDEEGMEAQLNFLKKNLKEENVAKMRNFLQVYNNLIIALGHQNKSNALGEIGEIGAAKITQLLGYNINLKGQEAAYTALFDTFVYNPTKVERSKNSNKSWTTITTKMSEKEVKKYEKQNLERRLKSFSDSQSWTLNGVSGKQMASLMLSSLPSQNKIDMTIQLEDNSKPVGVSIKNYDISESKGISVVTGSPFLYMVQALNINNNDFVNHWLNLTTYHNQRDGKAVSKEPSDFTLAKKEANELMQKILFIQGLTGYKTLRIQPTEEGKPSNKIVFMDEPDLFLLFARENGNTVAKVIPIPTIIKNAMSENNSFLISGYSINMPPFNRSFSQQEVKSFNNSGDERISYILRAMREAKIHISLNNAFIKSKMLKY